MNRKIKFLKAITIEGVAYKADQIVDADIALQGHWAFRAAEASRKIVSVNEGPKLSSDPIIKAEQLMEIARNAPPPVRAMRKSGGKRG